MESAIAGASWVAGIMLGLWVRSRIGDDALAKTVHEGEYGLLYAGGRFQRVLPPGRYLTLLTTKTIFVLPKWQHFRLPSADRCDQRRQAGLRVSASAHVPD
jgi:hypothetical protein